MMSMLGDENVGVCECLGEGRGGECWMRILMEDDTDGRRSCWMEMLVDGDDGGG